VFGARSEVVRLTVTVRDDEGRLVAGLTARDFTVLEEGRSQVVRLFVPAVEPGPHEELALDVGLLLDTSQSMAAELQLTQEAAVRFLQAIPRARDLLTIFFDQDIRISRYDSEHQQGLFDRILESQASGNTALYDAIAVYLSRVNDAPGRKVLVLLTDGEDTVSSLTVSEVLELARSSTATIYAIAFPGQYAYSSTRAMMARAFLYQLAALTGGAVFTPSRSKDLPAVYDQILEELSAQYVLGFVSDSPRRDGGYRRIKVEVSRKGLKLRHRAGYHSPDERGGP
jgi:Ca-activated chloride channel family protein